MLSFRDVRHRFTGMLLAAFSTALLAGATYAGAAEPGLHGRPAAQASGDANSLANSGNVGLRTFCAVGFDTRSGGIRPPDDTTSNNQPANVVRLVKHCAGPVIGTFTSETNTSVGSGDFIHIDVEAVCISTGGFASPCTVGTSSFAEPGHVFFQNVREGVQTHAMQFVWAHLPRGVYLFQVRPGGNGSATLNFRSFKVEAYAP